MAKEQTLMNELIVDGKLLKSWKGKRYPAGIKHICIAKLKGIEHKKYWISEEGVRTDVERTAET